MRTLKYAVIILAALFLSFGHSPPSRFAQTQKEPGSITGRVKLDDKPAKGITVIAIATASDATSAALEVFTPPTSVKAVTDSDGLYKLEGVPAGKYHVTASAPALVSADSYKLITVSESAAVEGVDFALSLGGVVTGRLTDNDGRPVIGERITLKGLDSQNHAFSSGTATFPSRMYATDDRGTYRIFGVPPGRYIVSAGKDSDLTAAFISQRPKRVHTFYPGVTEEVKAKPVQVNAGAEATGVDIQFGTTEKGFVVSGRVLDSESRSPIANAMVQYSKTQEGSTDDRSVDRPTGGMTTTNDKGEFRFASVAPGNYKLEASSIGPITATGGSQFYSDPLAFEVESTNVDKLDIKAHRGAGISGVVIVESADERDSLDRYGQLVLMALVIDPASKSVSSANSVVGPDGSFRLGGLKPGRVTLRTFSISPRRPGVLRIERSGVELPPKFEIQDKEEITGLRVILTPAIGIIRGRVTIQGGSLPRGAETTASARPLNADPLHPGDFDDNFSVDVSSDGSFVIENVTPGTYEVRVSSSVPGQSGSRVTSAQTVTVSGNTPVEIELVLDMNRKGSDK
jgi:protocatechuate 3,4-dioxygenase beta subunit